MLSALMRCPILVHARVLALMHKEHEEKNQES